MPAISHDSTAQTVITTFETSPGQCDDLMDELRDAYAEFISRQPGFIGALGNLLGEAQVNIATFNLGREESGGDAIALVGIDQDVPADTLEKIKALPQVRYVKVLKF